MSIVFKVVVKCDKCGVQVPFMNDITRDGIIISLLGKGWNTTRDTQVCRKCNEVIYDKRKVYALCKTLNIRIVVEKPDIYVEAPKGYRHGDGCHTYYFPIESYKDMSEVWQDIGQRVKANGLDKCEDDCEYCRSEKGEKYVNE